MRLRMRAPCCPARDRHTFDGMGPRAKPFHTRDDVHACTQFLVLEHEILRHRDLTSGRFSVDEPNVHSPPTPAAGCQSNAAATHNQRQSWKSVTERNVFSPLSNSPEFALPWAAMNVRMQTLLQPGRKLVEPHNAVLALAARALPRNSGVV